MIASAEMLAMSPGGTFRTWLAGLAMSVAGGKADLANYKRRFPKMTQSGISQQGVIRHT
jgi:hypothetical protein